MVLLTIECGDCGDKSYVDINSTAVCCPYCGSDKIKEGDVVR